MRVGLVALGAAVAFRAIAAPQLLVVANGDCRNDTALNFELVWLTDALKARSAGDVLNPAAVMAQLSPQPIGTVQDIERQVEHASDSFYDQHTVEAIAELDSAFEDIARLGANPSRWDLFKRANYTRALLLRLSHQQTTATGSWDDSYRRVLRIEPTASIERSKAPREMAERFEQIRREVTAALGAQKTQVTISSTPPGADIFLEGYHVGKTPLVKTLLPGRYQLLLTRGKASSFVRTIEVNSLMPLPLDVDLNWEQLFHSSPVPCFSSTSVDPILTAARLAGWFSAQQNVKQVVLISLQKKSEEAGFLVTSLVDVLTSKEIRSASLRLTNTAQPPKDIGDLANYLITGNQTANIVIDRTVRASPFAAASPPPPARPVSFPHVAAWTTLGAGIAGLGGFALVMAQQPTSIFPIGRDDPGTVAQKNFALAGFGVSAAVIGFSTYYLIRHSAEPPAEHGELAVSGLRLDVSPSRAGAAVTLRGSLP